MSNLTEIQNTFKKVNKKNLTIQSFLFIGFSSALVYSFTNPLAVLPGMLVGANLPNFLLEWYSYKLLKDYKYGQWGLFSKNKRYNDVLVKKVKEYLNNSESETEKKYKTFFLTLWTDVYSPYNINKDKMLFKDIFIFQAIKMNFKLMKNMKNSDISKELDEQEKFNKENNFFTINNINNYKFRTDSSDKLSDLTDSFMQEVILDMQDPEKRKGINKILEDFKEYSFLGNALISNIIKEFYKSADEVKNNTNFLKEIKLKTCHNSIHYIDTFLTLQEYCFTQNDMKLFKNVLKNIKEDDFESNFSYFSLSDKVINKILENNTLENSLIFCDILKKTNVRIKNEASLSSEEVLNSLIMKKTLEENLTSTSVNTKRRAKKI